MFSHTESVKKLPVNCLMKLEPKDKHPAEPVPGTMTIGGICP